ncbi:hypothetical protein R1flu_004445 [Riccia fluitans]|uniref:Uncharacterized protein n=1 Tax=Riccia fluitans TaxID=41844 RepID=A0ABD1YQB6_9MARC
MIHSFELPRSAQDQTPEQTEDTEVISSCSQGKVLLSFRERRVRESSVLGTLSSEGLKRQLPKLRLQGRGNEQHS